MFTHALLFKAICHKKSKEGWPLQKEKKMSWPSLCFYLVAKLYLTLCDPMNYSMGGVPVLHYLPEFVQIEVHGETVSHPTILSAVTPSPLALSLSYYQGLFQWVGSLHQVAKVLVLQLQHQSFPWMFRVDFL